ncbi:MAG: cytochrome b/b6 domain-containing protein [Burkholderiaceae bacterium]
MKDRNNPSILVWDAPVRVFHWLMVICFVGAFVSAESERWRLLHNSLGYTMGALVAFRLLWGLIGTRHARFAGFIRGPRAVLGYLRSLLRGQPEHHVGHNPAGALAIVVLLGLAVAVTATGWAGEAELGGRWSEAAHKVAANLMLAVVLVHVAAVLISSCLHHENLVAGMLTGRKPGAPEMGIRNAWRSVAVVLLMAVFGFWWQQWQARPAGPGAAHAQLSSVAHQTPEADAH